MREGEREEKTAEEVTILSYLLFPCKYPKARVRESAFATCSLSVVSCETIEKNYAKNASHHFATKQVVCYVISSNYILLILALSDWSIN